MPPEPEEATANGDKGVGIIIALLKKDDTDDTEKIAYLTLLINFVKDKRISAEVQEELCRAIDCNFIHRLLTSKGDIADTREFKQVSLAIIRAIFLRVSQRDGLNKMIPDLIAVAKDPEYTKFHQYIIDTLYFLLSTPGCTTKLNIFSLLSKDPTFMFQSPHRINWFRLLARLITTIPTYWAGLTDESEVNNQANFNQMVLNLAMTSLDKCCEKESVSVDERCERINCLAEICKYRYQNLFDREDFSDKFKNIFSELLKHKVSPRSRVRLLGVGPLISTIYDLDDDEEMMVLLYRLSTIELKLRLEMVVQGVESKTEKEEEEEKIGVNLGDKDSSNPIYQVPDADHEENVQEKESIEATKVKSEDKKTVEDKTLTTYAIAQCCHTVENCVEELVNGDTVTAHTQTLIDSIRMAMASAMFFLRNTECLEHKAASAVIRVFAFWLTEDTAPELEDITSTLKVLIPVLCEEKKDLLKLLVSALVNQMENEAFQLFVERELCPVLIAFAKANLWEEDFVNVVPVFNNLLLYDKYPAIPGNESSAHLPFTIQLPEQIDLRYLSTVQLQCFLFICYHNNSSHHFITTFEPIPWLNNVVRFVLSPFDCPLAGRREGLPGNWPDLEDVWLSTVHALCLVINMLPDPSLISCDLTSLAAKCSNYSETLNEVTGSLETLLASLAAREN